jgi:hypothetical protein
MAITPPCLARARHVGVLEHVRAAVHARALAVPDAEHAVVFLLLGVQVELLRAPHGGGAQLFVHAGLEDDVVFGQVLLGRPQRLVVGAQRAAPVAADEARRVQPRRRIALALQHGQAHQGLHAAHEGAAFAQGVFVFQRDGFERFADGVGQMGRSWRIPVGGAHRNAPCGRRRATSMVAAAQCRHCAAICAFVFMPCLPSIQKGSFLKLR